jgi:hypothetical protein
MPDEKDGLFGEDGMKLLRISTDSRISCFGAFQNSPTRRTLPTTSFRAEAFGYYAVAECTSELEYAKN